MKKSFLETLVGAFVLGVALVFAFILMNKANFFSQNDGYRFVAEFDRADGLTPGTDVRIAGVSVGEVTKQYLDPQAPTIAEITISIDDSNLVIPEDTTARVLSDGLLGGAFIALELGGRSSTLKETGRLDLAYTQGAVNLVDLIGQFAFSTTGKDKEESEDPSAEETATQDSPLPLSSPLANEPQEPLTEEENVLLQEAQ